MSVVRDLILKADDDLRYPSSGELNSIVEFLSQGSVRLSVVRILSDNEKKIVDESARQLFSLRPEYVAPGGNTYGQLGLGDIEVYLSPTLLPGVSGLVSIGAEQSIPPGQVKPKIAVGFIVFY